jgi:hypothetical protein
MLPFGEPVGPDAMLVTIGATDRTQAALWAREHGIGDPRS